MLVTVDAHQFDPTTLLPTHFKATDIATIPLTDTVYHFESMQCVSSL
jgi:hypothetical protein